jgi:O-antigen ligase
MTTQDWLYRIFASRYRWLSALATLVLCAVLAVAVGLLLSELGPLITGAGMAGLFLGVWMLQDIEAAYWAVIGVVCLLPFASFPFDLGFTPTLLDAALGALFLVWLLQIASGAQDTFVATPLGLPVIVFMLLAVGSFVFGLAHVPLVLGFLQTYIRRFAEVMLSVALFFLVVNTVQEKGRLRRVVRALILGAFASAVLGVGLYIVADQISSDVVIRALSALGRIGYPTGPGVLRYIRDNPELPMRATSTSVDPNVLGSLLNVTLAISVPQLFIRRPIIPRRYLVPMLGAMALCLGLTMSRGSMVGLGAALVLLATLRYRKLWIVLAGALALMLLLPQTQALVSHFIEGFLVEDLATQMRMGEYKDALILIRRYPLLGVGFAGSPDIDTYIGVANLYLLIAEEMGLVGLTGFLVVMGVIFIRFWRTARGQKARHNEDLEPLWWGLHAGLVGALTGGVFDHYFFNLDFHHSVTLFWLVVGLATAATELKEVRRTGERCNAPGSN